MTIKTESGSEYIVDPLARVWSCQKSATSGIRTTSGVYLYWSGVEIGKPMWFVAEGLFFGTRVIMTSPVISYMTT